MNILKYIYIGLFLIVMTACVNDDTIKPDVTDDYQAPTVSQTMPENFTGMVLTVPTSKCFSDGKGTRATDADRSKEGWLTNLYLIAIADGIGEEESNGFNVIELNTSGTNPQVNEGETLFYVNLYPGHSYRFYLLANFDRYLSRFESVSDATNEKEVKNTILNFSSTRQLEPAHLPMACMPADFYCTGDPRFQGGVLTIPEKVDNTTSIDPVHIYADLKFLCAKVRYTILYNNQVGGFSEMFGNNSIRFVVNQNNAYPTASYIRRQTRLFLDQSSEKYDVENFYITDDDTNTGNITTWNLTLSRYQFPVKKDASGNELKDAKGNPVYNEDYPLSANDMLEEWPNDRNLNTWKEAHQRAWQGVIYLPENNPVAETGITKLPDQRTVLRFPFVMEKYKGEDGNYVDADFSKADGYKEILLFDKNSQTHYPGKDDYNDPEYGNETKPGDHWLARGYFYDVVAKVVNPDPDDLEMFIQVYVSDQPWVYHENTQIW